MRKKIHITNNESAEAATDTADGGDDSAVEPHETPTVQSTRPVDGEDAYVVALQAELEDARKANEEAEKRVLYVQAEFQNYRRRKEDEFKESRKYANGELLLGVLPVVDSFERALAAAEQTQNMDSLLTGLAGALKQLQTFLAKAGVKPIETLGKEFDPKYHEAIGHTESEEYPPHTVAEEVQRGYMVQDRVLRPALVKVTED